MTPRNNKILCIAEQRTTTAASTLSPINTSIVAVTASKGRQGQPTKPTRAQWKRRTKHSLDPVALSLSLLDPLADPPQHTTRSCHRVVRQACSTHHPRKLSDTPAQLPRQTTPTASNSTHTHTPDAGEMAPGPQDAMPVPAAALSPAPTAIPSPSSAPSPTSILSAATNPLHDHAVLATVIVGMVVAVALLTVVVLILCCFRARHGTTRRRENCCIGGWGGREGVEGREGEGEGDCA